FYRVDGADFVVHMHERDERGVVSDGVGHLARLDAPRWNHIQVTGLHPRVACMLDGVEHRMMFDPRRDHMLLASGLKNSFNYTVVALSSTTRKYVFGRIVV